MNKIIRKFGFSILIIASLFFLLGYRITAEESADTKEVAEDLSNPDAIPEAYVSNIGKSDVVSLDFEDTEIRDVLRVISEISGMNIVVTPEIQGKVTVQLKDVTWEKALEVILLTYNLTYKKEGNLIRVMTLDQLKLEEEKIPLTTKIMALNFAKAEDIKPSLEKMKSGRGTIEVNIRTNSLIVTDLPDTVQKIEEIAVQLDSRTPQVMIEALVADVKIIAGEEFGIDWTLRMLSAPESASAETIMEQDLSLTDTTDTGSISFGKTILRSIDIDGLIEMYRQDQRVDILANPRIMTLDNQMAKIELVEQIPYTSTSESTESANVVTTTQFKDAGVKLYVTPHITTKDNWISMNLKVEQSFRSGYVEQTTEPIVDSRKAETNLMVKNGDIIVIGGLRKKEDSVSVEKIPVLGDIPVLGNFFRRTVKDKTDVDLLIFVTPTIVEEPKLTKEEKDRYDLFKDKPIDLIGPNQKLESEFLKSQDEKTEPPTGSSAIIYETPKATVEETFSLRPPSK